MNDWLIDWMNSWMNELMIEWISVCHFPKVTSYRPPTTALTDSWLSDMAVTSSSSLTPWNNVEDLSHHKSLKISNSPSHFFEFFDGKIWIQTGISTSSTTAPSFNLQILMQGCCMSYKNPHAKLDESTGGFPSCFSKRLRFWCSWLRFSLMQQVYGMKPTEWGNIGTP